MENRAQINCSCSLISIGYKFEEPVKNNIGWSSINHQNRQNFESIHGSQKGKISLSRSTSKQSKEMKQRQIVQSKASINLNNSISHQFPSVSFDSKISQYDSKIKKKFLVIRKHEQSAKDCTTQKQHNKEQKNTTLDSSLEINNRKFYKQRFTEHPFLTTHQVRKIQQQQKQSKHQQHQKKQKHYQRFEKPTNIRNDVKKNSIYESQNLQYTTQFSNKEVNSQKNNNEASEIRRIRPLNQLQCRNVTSSGKISSQNHISMVISEDSDLYNLQGLGNLMHKSSSPLFHKSQISELIF